MPWQQVVADVALEVDEATGLFAYKLVLVTVPRQSGKTTLFGSVLEHRALTVPRGRCWFTMQTAKDAVDFLINVHWPLMAPLGAEVRLRRAAGSEDIRWRRSMGMVRPFPPTPDGLHGKTSDLVVVDECWAYDLVKGQAIDQAIVPTQATRPGAQVWKVSTAGDAGSTWWLGSVEAGRAAVAAGRRAGLAYFEWSCPDNLDPTEPSSWPRFHPAYGRTIDAPAMAAALEMLGPDEFARAYGNRWVSSTARVIPLEAWRRALEAPADLPGPGELVLGFDVAGDRSDGAVVAAWRDAAGVAHLEVADQRPGVGWLVDRLDELVARWRPPVVAYDTMGPAPDVADAASRRGLEVVGLTTKDYVTACAALLEDLIADPPKARYRQHPALDAAASSAARRAVGDAWGWGRRQSAGSLACLTAATVALWAWDHRPAANGPFRVY